MIHTSKAYVVRQVGAPFELTDVVLDEVRDHEVLVELLYTGICHTDIVVKDGGMPCGGFPAVLGHEGLGVIRRVGIKMFDPSLQPGDNVLLSFHSCRSCRWCKEGGYGGCPHMTETNFINTARSSTDNKSPISSAADGTPIHGQFFGQSSLSQFAVATERSIVKLADVGPADLPFLAPLACGYLAGAGAVFNVLRPRSTDKVAVLGMGAVGFAAVMAAKACGATDIVAVDIVAGKLELAAEVGASHTINTREFGSLSEGIKSAFPRGVDVIVDATGVAPLIQDAVNALGHGGTLALVGVPPPNKPIQVDALDLLLSCKRIVGIIEGHANPQELIPRILKLYREGKFPVDKLSTLYPFDKLENAISDLKSGQVIKPILSWQAACSHVTTQDSVTR